MGLAGQVSSAMFLVGVAEGKADSEHFRLRGIRKEENKDAKVNEIFPGAGR